MEPDATGARRTVSTEVTLAEACRGAMRGGDRALVVLDHHGRRHGVLYSADVDQVPLTERTSILVGVIARRETVSAEHPAAVPTPLEAKGQPA